MVPSLCQTRCECIEHNVPHSTHRCSALQNGVAPTKHSRVMSRIEEAWRWHSNSRQTSWKIDEIPYKCSACVCVVTWQASLALAPDGLSTSGPHEDSNDDVLHTEILYRISPHHNYNHSWQWLQTTNRWWDRSNCVCVRLQRRKTIPTKNNFSKKTTTSRPWQWYIADLTDDGDQI